MRSIGLVSMFHVEQSRADRDGRLPANFLTAQKRH
jgi:hypothetical protein